MSGVPWVLADDLSGALEAGAAWRKRGWRVLLPLNDAALLAGTRPVLVRSPGNLVRLCSTESRNLSPEQAFTMAKNALTHCAWSGGALRYKKIDSTLRGPIAAEIRAVVETLAPPVIVITPANPAQGRTVINGELRVDGKPVAETAFGRDPLWPVLHGSMSRLLREGKVEGVRELRAASRIGVGGLIDAIETSIADGDRVLVADAERPGDLLALVTAVSSLQPRVVFVGSGALAPILAGQGEPIAPVPCVDRAGAVLYVLGSKHGITQAQLSRLMEIRRVPRVSVFPESGESAGDEAVRILSNDSSVALAVEEGVQAYPEEIRQAMDAAARRILTQRSVRAVFATGGETARGVCDALDGTELEIVGEIEPGVVQSVVQTASGPVTLIVKPGGFGTPETLLSVAAALEAESGRQ